MRELLGYIDKKAVPIGIRTDRNKKKLWEYGYNKEFDIIVISKDGTIGDVYCMEGLKIALPRVPNDKSLIINSDLPKKEQKWAREPLPQGLREDTKEKYEDYIVSQYQRRENGVFVMIDGEPEYFPGSYYFFLQWFSIGRQYPDFRYTQKDLMIFWEACVADPRCYGILYVKNRRLGWSTLGQSECNNRGTLYREGLIGIISKTGKDAKSFFRKTVSGFRKLPFFFRPETDGTTNPKTELAFTSPAKRITHKSGADYDDGSEALNTFIQYFNTDLNSMDSEKIAPIQIIEEPGKFPKQVPFSEYWSVAKECLTEGDEIVGKAMIGSTINPPDEGGDEFKKVWDISDPSSRDGNDQTVSGLYRIFIPAEYNIRGYFDEYGFPILEDPEKPVLNNEGKYKSIGAITYLNNKEESLKGDPEALASQKRKYPRTIVDAFRSANDKCSFNATKLYQQMDYVNIEMPLHLIQTGRLIWENGVPDTAVRFVHDPQGLFKLTWRPPQELRNNVIQSSFGKKPGNAHLGALGVDPYNRSETAFGTGSKGSIHGLTKDNMTGVPSNFFFLEYIGRPAKVHLFYEDVIKAMVYFGMPIAAEQSNDEFLRILKNRGYRPFVLTRPDVHFADLNPTEKELGGFPPQGEKLGNSQFYAVEAYIEDYIGYATDERNRKMGEIGKMYFYETLKQWLAVDPNKRTKFDAYISSSLAIIANQKKLIQKKTKPTALDISVLPTYDNSGRISKKSA